MLETGLYKIIPPQTKIKVQDNATTSTLSFQSLKCYYSNMELDVRWRQRYKNFEKALSLLEKTLKIKNLDEIQRAGMVQFFEMTFELSWKLMKDYLEDQGFTEIRSPRDSIKKSFEIGLLPEAAMWLKGLEDRNLTAHTYNEKTALEVERLIRDTYFSLFKNLKDLFSAL